MLLNESQGVLQSSASRLSHARRCRRTSRWLAGLRTWSWNPALLSSSARSSAASCVWARVDRSTGTVRTVLIAEELLLLFIDDETGKMTLGGEIDPALGGALLVQLALMERIGVTLGRRRLASARPGDDHQHDADRRRGTGQPDGVAGATGGGQGQSPDQPVSSKRITKGLRDRLLQRLVRAGCSGSSAARSSDSDSGRRSIRGRRTRCAPGCRPRWWVGTLPLSVRSP